ncbi:MAG TPA: SpoIIE family protein phosphatase [Vicinamibacteria bacterium]|jgi:sigma-B regulation protein RsbU (phosphoserine phosphatase)
MSALLQPASAARDLARVLVVDDLGDVRRAIQLLLKSHGYETHAAGSPAAAISAIEREKYDLLIMDLNYTRDTTSGREGLDLVPLVRAADPSLPIVAMTAWSTVPLAVAALRGGVDDFVEKPWDNSRLLETVEAHVAAGRARRLARRLQDDARDVQSRMLGPALPPVAGYDVGVAWRFAQGLGGDACEVVPLRGGRLAVAVADVCGKGLPAALLMASLHAELQEAAAAELSPRETARRVAARMGLRLGPDRYVSLVYAILDRAAGTLVYVNAGHPPAFLLGPEGGALRLATGGPVIGLGRETDFEEAVLPIGAGDRLVLYTDGVTEAGGVTGEEFGERRVADLVSRAGSRPAAEVAARLIEAAAEHAGGALHDDATALVLTVE